jgi:hypothetical protein
MSDNSTIGLDRFLNARERPLDERFPGMYRALVVETDDPLCMHRIRFKCPEMHDFDLPPQECPWAVSQFSLGGRRAGSWTSPCIGDWVWITFEKQHPYGPVWTGFCTPTRRKFYPYPSVSGVTPLPVDANGDVVDQDGNPIQPPDDYDPDYLPYDSRPMSTGFQDRYGNLDISNAVGFFPVEHQAAPPSPDNDPLQAQANKDDSGKETPYKQTTLPPKMNDPDGKYMARISKYGHILLMGDQGYIWRKRNPDEEDEDSDETGPDGPVNSSGGAYGATGATGEFYGDVEKDEQWEIARWKYIQQLINEGATTDVDQRRFMSLTRYGHKFEMRDVGWNWTREGEYDNQRTISDSELDERWIKLRTKGGMLFQMSDIGFDPIEDTFVKRLLLDEVGANTENEDEYWTGDARWIRWVSRYGYKFVIDDRGTDTKDADTKENPRGYGILLKGRRTPGAQGATVDESPKGFYWEVNEKDQVNQTTWGSPLGSTIQINDKLQYVMIGNKSSYPMPWKGIKDNEFLEDPLVADDTELKSHHLKLDFHNEYIRLKTAGGNSDDMPWGDIVNPQARQGIQQGLECRDGSKGDDPWTELVDLDARGLWFSGKEKLTVCRARQYPNSVKICWWFDEIKKEIVIRNDESGKIQIACSGDVEVIAQQNVKVFAANDVTVRSNNRVVLMGGGGALEVNSGAIIVNKEIIAGIVSPPDVLTPSTTPQLEPTNRGERYNKKLEINTDIAEDDEDDDSET